MAFSQFRLILAAILALLLGACDAMPVGDFYADAPVRQRAEQSVSRAIPPVEAQAKEVTGPGDEKKSAAPSEVSPAEYSVDAIDYLAEVGFGVEFGSSPPMLRRWGGDIRIKVHGEPTDADQAALHDVIQELNRLASALKLTLTKSDANVDIHFIPESRFSVVEPKYVPMNWGFFRVWWDGDGVIYRGKILISSQGLTQPERSHLIREELTQTLGLFRDSWRYRDSIFYQGWTSTEEYSPLDRQIIGMLYSPQVAPGMDREQVLGALRPD